MLWNAQYLPSLVAELPVVIGIEPIWTSSPLANFIDVIPPAVLVSIDVAQSILSDCGIIKA